MTHNETVLRNLYAELNLAICHHEQVEEKYLASCVMMSKLNLDIIETKKLVEKENKHGMAND